MELSLTAAHMINDTLFTFNTWPNTDGIKYDLHGNVIGSTPAWPFSPIDGFCSVQRGDSVWIMGGLDKADPLFETAAVRIFHIPTQAWSIADSSVFMPVRRYAMHCAVDAMNNIYVAGGISNTLSSRLDIFNGTHWGRGADMPVAVHSGAVVELNGVLYVIAGRGLYEVIQTTVQAYVRATDTWGILSSLPVRRAGVGASVMQTSCGSIILVYGSSGACSSSAATHVYNPVSDTWVNGTAAFGLLGQYKVGTGATMPGQMTNSARNTVLAVSSNGIQRFRLA